MGDQHHTNTGAAGAGRKERPQHDEYKMIGTYKIKGSLGEGVNGAVRLGIDAVTGRKVAVKFMSKVNMKQKQRERLDREVRFLTLLHHPNIVELIEVIDTAEHVVFVMEQVRKGELLKYITDNGHLKEKEFRVMFRAILSAVDYCHRNSVVHRDLKPENILLDEHKNPKVIDFGLSNMYDNDKLLDTFCGSPKYAAPEIISGTQYLGPSVDVWSLGVILFAALSGTLPFSGSTLERTYARILAGKINYPAHFSNEVKDLIGRVLKVNVDERLTLEQMMNHPWVVGTEGPPPNFLPHRPPTVQEPNQATVKLVMEFFYTEDEVLQAIKKDGLNPIKNTYFLLAERKERQDELKRERNQTLDDDDQSSGSIRDAASGLVKMVMGSLRLKNKKAGKELDLTYVVPNRVISMGFPAAAGIKNLYVNPIQDLYAFFEKNHKDHYKVFNLLAGEKSGGYDPKLLGGHVVRFPVQMYGPTFETMVGFCKAMDEWLNQEPQNVAAVHAKGDHVRPAVMICAWLLHCGRATTTDEALKMYNSKMFGTEETQSVPPSFRRYIMYYEEYVKRGKVDPPNKLFALSVLVLEPVPEFDVYGGCDPIAKIDMNHVRVAKTTAMGIFSTTKGDTQVVIECKTVPLSDDVHVRVIDRDRHSGEEMFSFRINMRFLEWCHNVEHLASDFMVPTSGKKTDDGASHNHYSDRIPFVSTIMQFTARPKGTDATGAHGAPDVSAPPPVAASTPSPTTARVAPPPPQQGGDGETAVAGTTPVDESLWTGDDPDDLTDDEGEEDPDEGEDEPEEFRHPLEREHFDDTEAVQEPAAPKARRNTPHLIFFKRPTEDEQTQDTDAAPPHPSSAAASSSSIVVDPYVASRVRVVLTRADLDLHHADRFPAAFKVSLLMKEPRVRRYTAEDIEMTARLEAQAATD